MELDLQLKKHFLMENNEHGLIVLNSKSSRDFTVESFAQTMKVNGYDIIALDRTRAENIYKYKAKIANELSDKTFIVVKGAEFFCSILAQDVIRFYEKRAKFSKVLITAIGPISEDSDYFKVALNYAGDKVLFEDEESYDNNKVAKILELHPEGTIGYYELLEDDGKEYVFNVKKSMTSGMLKLRKDKANWKNDESITPAIMLERYFADAEEKPSEKDMQVLVDALRKMEIPPRMILL